MQPCLDNPTACELTIRGIKIGYSFTVSKQFKEIVEEKKANVSVAYYA